MQAVEVTIQNLIGSGMDPKTENNPYLGFIYTSFQERATAVSHGATARHALELGDKTLGRICGAIASDEKRHERAYCMIVSELFRRWILAFLVLHCLKGVWHLVPFGCVCLLWRRSHGRGIMLHTQTKLFCIQLLLLEADHLC